VDSDESTGDFNYQHGLHLSHHKKTSYVYGSIFRIWHLLGPVQYGQLCGLPGVRHIAQKKLTELSCERRECEPKYRPFGNDLHSSGSRVHTKIFNQCV
jgi:hypothetical protein